MCNGGFLFGKDAALLIEGFVSPAGASFQYEALRTLSPTPIMGAVDTHDHFDHVTGNAFYGNKGISLWTHASVSKRIFASYGAMQGADKAAFLRPLEARVKNAKDEVAHKHAAELVATMGNIFDTVDSTVVGFPNRPLDPAKLPVKFDLGGVTALIETYPGHSGTELIVRVPEQNVVCAGDLLFNHMYPVAGRDGVQVSLELFDDVAAQAEKMYNSGLASFHRSDDPQTLQRMGREVTQRESCDGQFLFRMLRTIVAARSAKLLFWNWQQRGPKGRIRIAL